MADEKTWPRKCTACGDSVEFNGKDQDWNGFGPCKRSRGKHSVAAVIYYSPGARDIQDQRDRRRFSPTIVLIPGYDRIIDGKPIQTRKLVVQFQDGKLETIDPEVQYMLEEKKDVAWGAAGLQMWREIYLTITQQNDLAKAELEVTKREIRESNDLLAQVKAAQAADEATKPGRRRATA